MSSLANTGDGTLIQIKVSTSWVTIGEIVKSPWSGRKNNTTNVPHFQSTAQEFNATLPTSGDFKLTYNYVSTDAGQQALATAFANKTTPQFQVTIPTTGTQTSSGDIFAFNALVEELAPVANLSPDAAMQAEASLKISGAVTITAGS